ncbi:hypothetical protein LTT66_13000 [Nocardia gipuzkoensis]|uniref:WXG100 family type VII secretion target n=1 Tax=Nocardia gipuzkoensis TaxID=2749991 RepID=UPI001E4CEA10|nr:WXG100 family type VII secretion target [Nocardia gipuzkoensis]UGT70991.1 hypothetical protein LTT66_13000 [Nocardia gipuzkoensis]
MAQSLRVDTDLLRALTPELAAIADAAQQELARLKDRLATEGECWGEDEPGRVFGDSYEPAAEKGITGFENLVHNLRGMSSSVADAGDALQDQDQNVGSQLRNQDPFGYDPVVGPSYDQPPWQTPEPLRPATAPDVADPNSAPRATAPDQTPDPDAARPSDQPGYQSGGGNPVVPGQPYPGDYGPHSSPYLPDQQASPGATPTPSVPDRPAPTSRSTAPTGQKPPSPTAATPSAATPSTANPPPAAATPKAGAPDPAAERRPPENRLSRPPAQSPWLRNAPGTPWSRSAPGSSGPGQVYPPRRKGPDPGAARPAQPGKDTKQRKPKPVSPEPKRSRVRTDPDAVAAAEALAARHNLRVVGFGDSGVAKHTVDEIAAAVDHILGKYPFVRPAGIEITDLPDGTVSRVVWERTIDEGADPVVGGWILLDRVTAANRVLLAEKVDAAIRSGERVAGSEERPMYSTIVRDLGRILEAGSGPHVRQSAHRSLIMEYRRVSGPWDRGDTLAGVVRGYREWRAQLIRACLSGGFDPVAAVVEAFTEVELRGEAACGPAKVLHRMVVEHARGQSSA